MTNVSPTLPSQNLKSIFTMNTQLRRYSLLMGITFYMKFIFYVEKFPALRIVHIKHENFAGREK